MVFLRDFIGATEYAYDSVKKDKSSEITSYLCQISYFSLSRLTA